MLVSLEHLDVRLLGIGKNVPPGRWEKVVANGGVWPVQ
jgi:hypothetical protein